MRTTIAIAALLAVLVPQAVRAQDFGAYTELVERANAAHNLLADAPEHRQEALRETALDADMAVIAWLDEFLGSTEHGRLPADQQALVVRNRFRWEYNVTALLIPLERCEEARDRVRSLLDRPMNDEELRPRLTEAYEDAITCVNRPRWAYLTVAATPAESELYLDGVLLGLATGEFEVALGEHIITLRADGYVGEDRTIVAASEGQRIHLGDVTLMVDVIEPDSSVPTWYEWTLWGAGAISVGVGISYLLQAADRQDQIDGPPTNQQVLDRDRELGIVDDLRLVGFIAGGVGVAAIIAGTVSYAVRATGEEDPSEVSASVLLSPTQVLVTVPF